MYRIQHLIYDTYQDIEWEQNIVAALKIAKKMNSTGSNKIRIITPENTIIQVY